MTREEAINIVRNIYQTDKEKEALETLIPELAESEDERIRKVIRSLLENARAVQSNTALYKEYDDALAWLEKQEELFESGRGLYYYDGEKFTYCGYPAMEEIHYEFDINQQEKKQKEQKEIPLMNGDADLYFDNWIQHNDTTKRGCFEEGIRYAQRLQKEQNPVEIDEEINRWMGCEAFPEGINITPLPQAMEIVERTAKHFFELGEKTVPSPGGYWEGFNAGVRECQNRIRDVKDTMKEQKTRRVERYHELVFRDICKHLKKEGYDGWVLLLNALRNGEFKQPVAEWSDEDENIRQALILLVSNDKKNGYTEFYKAQEITCDKVIAFLKKLEQFPTNEEMLRTLRVEYEKGVADTIAKYEQKEQRPIKMEVYEVDKGTTICGQDYKCKKDYKEGNCWYIKDVIYHCSRDGYLNDQNGVSWSCTPEWFNEYIYTNNELADKEKTDFVSGQFLQCKLSFDDFKEGEHYWLEYVGDDTYVGRSDNILNQKFYITPRQLFTLFSQELEEVQGPPQEEKQVSLNYELPFDENPSDIEIIEALIRHLKEQDGFLTAIDCVSTKAILTWLEKQKEQEEQKHILKFKVGDKVHLEGDDVNILTITGIEKDRYLTDNSYGPILFGDEYNWERVEQKPLSTEETELNSIAFLEQMGYTCIPPQKEQKPRWEINNPHTTKWTKEMIDEKFEELVEEYHEQKPEWSEEDESFLDSIEEAIHSYYDLNHAPQYDYWLEEKLKSLHLQSKQEWSEEDEEMLDAIICDVMTLHNAKNLDELKDKIGFLKSLRPQHKK